MDAADESYSQRRLGDLLRVSSSVVEHLDLEEVLGRIVEAGMSLVGARYGALGVLGDDGMLTRFVHRGMPVDTARRIGDFPRGHGILGAVIAASEPVRLGDLAADPRSVGFPAHHPPMHSFLGVPVRVRDAVYGDLYLAEADAGRFTDADENLVVSLAAIAGIAIENARLYERATIREEWSAAIADVMGALLDVRGDDALEVIVDRIGPLVDADLVTLAVPTTDADTLGIVAARGAAAEALLGREHDVNATAAGRAMTSRRAVSAPTQPADAVFPGQAAQGPTVAVPLLAGDEVLGVLTVSRAPGAAAFTDADLEMAFVFAGQAGVAIEVVRGRDDRRRLEQADDRARIARDLHDHVIQRLFGAGLSLQALAHRHPEAADDLSTQIDTLDAAIREIRTVIFALGSAGGAGRGGARDRLLSVASEAGRPLETSPRVSFRGPVDSLVPAALVDELTGVLREGLTNVAKHADARTVDVTVSADDAGVHLEIRDDGRGIPPHSRRSGLANLAERARQRGGAFDVATSEAGTTLRWSAPFGESQTAPEREESPR